MESYAHCISHSTSHRTVKSVWNLWIRRNLPPAPGLLVQALYRCRRVEASNDFEWLRGLSHRTVLTLYNFRAKRKRHTFIQIHRRLKADFRLVSVWSVAQVQRVQAQFIPWELEASWSILEHFETLHGSSWHLHRTALGLPCLWHLSWTRVKSRGTEGKIVGRRAWNTMNQEAPRLSGQDRYLFENILGRRHGIGWDWYIWIHLDTFGYIWIHLASLVVCPVCLVACKSSTIFNVSPW